MPIRLQTLPRWPAARLLKFSRKWPLILNNILTATYDPLYIDYNYTTAISLSSKLRHKYALKSGTTSSDNWNIGFNKNVVCAVWVGNDDNKELTTKDYKYAQNIWYRTVEEIEQDSDTPRLELNLKEIKSQKDQNINELNEAVMSSPEEAAKLITSFIKD